MSGVGSTARTRGKGDISLPTLRLVILIPWEAHSRDPERLRTPRVG